MKTKTLAQVDGFIGIIAGAILAFLPVFIVFLAAISEDEDFAGVVLGIIFIVFSLVKIATLILGILSLVYYKDDNRVGPAGSILMIVGGIFTFNDFLGWIGAILSIIGGSLYLASLKRFQA